MSEREQLNDKSNKSNKIEKVGLTAFYTAAVWAELGLPTARRFLTRRGLFLRELTRFGSGFLGMAGHYSVPNLFLAARHLGLDYLLNQLQPTQVIELASGLSSRVARRQKPGIYIEVDQPGVIQIKRNLLPTELTPGHHLLALDLVDISGAELIEKLAPFLNPAEPTLILAEGLTPYLTEQPLRRLLGTLRELLDYFEDGNLLLDFYLKLDKARHGRVYWAMLPGVLFWKVLRAPMRLFLQDADAIRAIAESAGFRVERLYSSADLARLVGRQVPPVNLYYVAHLKS